MNKFLVITALLAVMVVVASGQRAGRRRGFEGGETAESSLRASDRALDARQAKLQRKEARRSKLDQRAARRESRRDRAARREAARLKSANAVDFATYDNEEAFSNLDASAKSDIGDRLAIQVLSDSHDKQQASISSSDGNRFSTGTKLNSKSLLEAEASASEEILSEDESARLEELSAADAEENLVDAQEAARQETEQSIDSQNAFSGGVAGGRTDVFDNDIFGNSPFGSPAFGNPFGRSLGKK